MHLRINSMRSGAFCVHALCMPGHRCPGVDDCLRPVSFIYAAIRNKQLQMRLETWFGIVEVYLLKDYWKLFVHEGARRDEAVRIIWTGHIE